MRTLVLAALLVGGLAGSARADHVFLREADAPRAVFPESTGADAGTLDLRDDEVKALEQMLGKRVEVRRYPYAEVKKGDALVGRVYFLDVLGQAKPIGFAVGVTAAGAVADVQVTVYRETQGEQIHEPRFRRQFIGKREGDPLALGKDIDAVSGATISSRAAAYAARKALALDAILRARGPDKRLGSTGSSLR